MERIDREKLPAYPPPSETEMERTEETGFKAGTGHTTEDPSRVRQAEVSLICSPEVKGPSCDYRERDRGSTKKMKGGAISNGKHKGSVHLMCFLSEAEIHLTIKQVLVMNV